MGIEIALNRRSDLILKCVSLNRADPVNCEDGDSFCSSWYWRRCLALWFGGAGLQLTDEVFGEAFFRTNVHGRMVLSITTTATHRGVRSPPQLGNNPLGGLRSSHRGARPIQILAQVSIDGSFCIVAEYIVRLKVH